MNLNIDNKTDFVTGGAAEIGLAIWKGLAGEGVNVIFTSRNKISENRSSKLLKKINPKCYDIICDLTK